MEADSDQVAAALIMMRNARIVEVGTQMTTIAIHAMRIFRAECQMHDNFAEVSKKLHPEGSRGLSTLC